MHLKDGLTLVVKRDCPTCTLLQPVYERLVASGHPVEIYTQDDITFPLPSAIDDTTLEVSYRLDIETVPTLISAENNQETARTVGWHKAQWQAISGMADLGADLPDTRPGCGALNVMPGVAERLQFQFGDTPLTARQIEISAANDEHEAIYERGWTDGLPVVPPTPARVLRMLQGTTRSADDVVGIVPPNRVACTVEKAAINAVMAGCKPEYMPVVLAAVEAACKEEFLMQGVLATTYVSGPIVIVNGPIAEKIGMNSGVNALGQGNRANATIGRTLQLIIRNVGGGKPGEIDRATMGTPGKYTFCFAEREHDSPWQSLAASRGESSANAVTLFGGGGVQPIMDQLSRTPESLANSFAASLLPVCHVKTARVFDVMLLVSPEHARVFANAGWDKARLAQELSERTMRHGSELVRGANGIAEGMPEQFADMTLPKLAPENMLIVRVGGNAGLFSAIVPAGRVRAFSL